MKSYIVYAKINSKDYIADVNSSAFLTSTAGWVRIDEGSSDLFRHAQKNYLPDDIITKDGAYRYKLVDGKVVACTAEELEAQRNNTLVSKEARMEERINALESGHGEIKRALASFLGKTVV